MPRILAAQANCSAIDETQFSSVAQLSAVGAMDAAERVDGLPLDRDDASYGSAAKAVGRVLSRGVASALDALSASIASSDPAKAASGLGLIGPLARSSHGLALFQHSDFIELLLERIDAAGLEALQKGEVCQAFDSTVLTLAGHAYRARLPSCRRCSRLV